MFFFLNHPRTSAPDVFCDLIITDSRNKTTTVNYVHDTLSNCYGWMAVLLDQETYSLRFADPCINKSLQVTLEFHSLACPIPNKGSYFPSL